MKYVVTYPGRYIAGIFTKKTDLRNFMRQVADGGLLAQLVVREVSFIYPFNIVEFEDVLGARIFYPCLKSLTKDVVKEFYGFGFKPLAAYTITKDVVKEFYGFGFKPLAAYTITKDFTGNPNVPGADYMGRLNHHHFDEEEEL